MEDNNLIEELANYEHNRWSRWQSHLFGKCRINKDGSLTIPKEFVDRWNRQINTSYFDLSVEEQKSDKEEAVRIINIIKNGRDNNE
mgnify:FL=1